MIGPLLAETLAGLGYEVCGIEATEAGAVAAAAKHRPDLMIVDVNLASGTGTAAMERITRAGPVPYLFMSGHIRQAAMPGEVLLTKPFRKVDLVQAIGRALTPAAFPGLTSASRAAFSPTTIKGLGDREQAQAIEAGDTIEIMQRTEVVPVLRTGG